LKNKWQPLFEALKWIFAVGMAFLYAMLVQLIISFLFLSVIHMNIETMLKVSIGIAVITAITYPVVKYIKSKK